MSDKTVVEKATEMTAQQIFALVVERYKDKDDDYVLSLGHFVLPCPDQPITIYNLPDFNAYLALPMKDVRRWAYEESAATIRSLMTELDEARSHVAIAISQSLPSDDQIIMGHVRSAKEILDAALAQARRIK